MNNKIRGLVYSFVGIAKAFVLKMERGSKAKICFPALISPLTEVSLDKGGSISVGRRICMRNGSRIVVRKKGCLTIGSNFYMNSGCIISTHDSISIGNNVELGPSVFIFDQDHDFRAEGGISANKFKTAPIIIGNDVWIGANSVILRGTVIGDGSVIAAGSIISGNIPAQKVVYQKRQTSLKEI